MNKNVKLLSPIVLALASTLSIQSHAAGTAAGTTVTNTALLNYEINGIQQTEVEADDEFKVDIKVDFSLDRLNNAPNTTSLEADNVVVAAFTITNTSNASTSFNLLANDEAAGEPEVINNETYTDTIDVGVAYSYYIDSNNNGAFDPLVDTELTQATTDRIVADSEVTVFVTVPNDDIAGVDEDVALTNVTVRGVQSEIDGVPFDLDRGDGDPANGSQDDANNLNGADTIEVVYADTGNNNEEVIVDALVLEFPNLEFAKTSVVVEDPFNEATNPKAIPGATVEYTITLENVGTADANNVVVTDVIPDNTTFVTGSIVVTDGAGDTRAAVATFTQDVTNPNDNGTVTANLGTVTNDSTAGLNIVNVTFQVTID